MKKIIQKIVLEKTENEFLRIFRAFFVGGVSTIFDLVTFLIVAKFTIWEIAQISGFFIGALVNYILTHLWVFSRGTVSKAQHGKDFLTFGIIGGIGLLLTIGIIFLLHEKMGFSLLTAKILSLVVFFWNYWARKHLIFERKQK